MFILDIMKSLSLEVIMECAYFVVDLHGAWLAQLVEHQTFNLRVKGSSPLSGDLNFFFFFCVWAFYDTGHRLYWHPFFFFFLF